MARTVDQIVTEYIEWQDDQNRMSEEFREAYERGETQPVSKEAMMRLDELMASISTEDVERSCEEAALVNALIDSNEEKEAAQEEARNWRNMSFAHAASVDQAEAMLRDVRQQLSDERQQRKDDNERHEYEMQLMGAKIEGLREENADLRYKLG